MRIALLVAVLGFLACPVEAAPPREAAANTLAAQGKLFCHRTYRATGWTTIGGIYHRETDQDPSDTTLCGNAQGGYQTIYSNAGPPTVATGLNGLPVMQLPSTELIAMTNNIYSMVGTQASPKLNGRFGWRFYRWNSADDRCAASKFVQMRTYWTATGGRPQDNAGVMWGANATSVPGARLLDMRNEWWRWEVYYNGAYWTGVSSATIFLTRLSTGVSYSTTVTGGLWPGGPPVNPDGTPFTGEHDLNHEYRDVRQWPDGQTVTGPCTVRLSYLLMGHNLGPTERIQISTEVEGGTPSVPLNTPTDLRGCRGANCPISGRTTFSMWAYVEKVWQWLVG